MKPFNLADALTKEPVQLRNGQMATVVADLRQLSNYKGEYPLIIVLEDGRYTQVRKDGRALAGDKSGVDIVGMWEKPESKRFINGVEVPEPVSLDNLRDGMRYWYVDLCDLDNVDCDDFYKSSAVDKKIISQKLVFETKEGAKAMARALLNYKVEVGEE